VKRGMTETGTVLGTSNYIAPEQASGDRVDAQTDVYSLGVVLFELLTDDVPFDGQNFVSVALRHINEPAPSVLDRRGDVSPRVAEAVSRALAKDPRDRYSSMDAFAAELEACLHEVRAGAEDPNATVLTVPVPSPARRGVRTRRRLSPGPLLVSLLALAALALIVVAAVAVQRDRSVLPGVSATHGGGGSTPVSLSAVTAYDPNGGGGEHNSDASQATDENPVTYWRTEHYARPDFGGLKDGVGLVLNAPGAVALKTLTVTSETPGFIAVVKAGNSAGTAQADSDPETVGTKTTFDLNGLSGSVYVLWITRLPAGGRAQVNEVTAKR